MRLGSVADRRQDPASELVAGRLSRCRTWKIEPDTKVLAYQTTYQRVRADLKNLSASA